MPVDVMSVSFHRPQIPGIIAFTRCGPVHHNLAIQTASVAFPHHIAFEVDDIDDEFLYSFGPPPPTEFLEPADMVDLIAASN